MGRSDIGMIRYCYRGPQSTPSQLCKSSRAQLFPKRSVGKAILSGMNADRV